MAVTADKPAPYTAPSAVLEVIDRFRNRGLPTPITADVLGRASVSPGLIPRTLQALQTLDLIGSDGKPTKTFEGIRLAPEAEYKKRLEDWLKAAYADVFAYVDPSKDTEVQIRDAFRAYTPAGQQARMVTLFQGLCAAAGLGPNKATTAPRPAAPFPSPRLRTAAKRVIADRFKDKPLQHTPDVPAPLAGLLARLPAEGDTWTQDEHDKFVTAFEAMLNFCFPIVEHGADDEMEDPS